MRIYKRRKSPFYWVAYQVNGKMIRRSLKTEDRQEAFNRARAWLETAQNAFRKNAGPVALSHAVDAYLDHCEQNDLARNTLRSYRARLQRFLEFAGDQDITKWDEETAYEIVCQHLESRVRNGEISTPKHDRTILSAFFAYTIGRRWYRHGNPARRELHLLRRPRRRLRKPRRISAADDMILRREASKLDIWPVVMLARWAGFRRGEATTLRWRNVNFAEGFVDLVGEEGGRKHPRRVWVPHWIVLQLRHIKAAQKPQVDDWTIWPHHPDTFSYKWQRFCVEQIGRKIGMSDLRASWVTEVFERGMTAQEEAKIGGHSPAVAEKYYSDYTAMGARDKMPTDPLLDRVPSVRQQCAQNAH